MRVSCQQQKVALREARASHYAKVVLFAAVTSAF